VFSYLINPTNSRSGILFLIIGTAFALNIIPRRIIYGKKGRILFFLIVPLIIAILVSIISGTNLADSLNTWSYKQFEKPIFNGRDELWIEGFKKLSESPFLGIGNPSTANWHNSAVSCLVGYGCIGYLFWIASLQNILKRAICWLDDYIIQGCVVAFIVLYLQQTVELGFIGESPSVLPYVMLGMMLGRIRYLKSLEIENR
jgi:O-antigen ligase